MPTTETLGGTAGTPDRGGWRRGTGLRELAGWVSLAALLVVGGCAASPSAEPEPSAQASTSGLTSDELVAVWMAQLGECASDAGFPVKLLPAGDGLEIGELNDSQWQDYLAAMDVCYEEYGDRPPGIEPLTEEGVGGYYDLLMEQWACLSRAGFPVREMPSRETWVASYLVGGDDAPLPLAETNRVDAAYEACPQPTLQEIHGF